MALTRDFKVKDSLSVGISGLFRAGETSYNANKVAIDTYGRILSGGRDLATVFANITLATLSQGSGIATFSYNGGSAATVAVAGAASLTSGFLTQWNGTSFVNSTLSDSAIVSLRTSVNSLSDKWNSNYTTLNSLSANWVSTNLTTNTLSSRWESSYTTTNANSANWNTGYTLGQSVYTTTNTNSANWNTGYNLGSSVYSSYNTISGSILKDVTIPTVQGQFTLVELDNINVTRTLHNLSLTGSPMFATLSVTGGVSAATFTGDGAGLTNVTATPTFPGTAVTDLASSHFFFVNDNASGLVAGNKRITYLNLLTDLAGTGLAVAADSDSIILKNSTSLSNNTITFWDSSAGQLTNSVITTNAGVISVGGSLSANGNFGVTGSTVLDGALSVKGDIILGDAATDTLTVNAGPVNFPNATAAADALVFGADANLYRSAADVLRTDDSFIVGANLTVNGDITLGDTNTDTLTINAGPINFPNATGTADALILGTDSNLYRSAVSTLRTNSSLVVDGNTTISGNLSVLGDVTQINTLVSVTSALSVINFGSGPAIYVEQTGVQPIAQFVDKEGGVITFSDTGSVGIGTVAGAIPVEKLSVVGSISASGTLKLGGLAAGTTNSVVIDSSGTLQNRTINPSVWDTAASFISGAAPRTTNTIPKFGTNTNGITNSTITDNGTDVTIGGNVIITPTHRIKHYAESGDTTLFIHTAVFSKGLSGTGTITVVPTFDKTDLKSSKYSVTLFQGANRTAFEILAVYDGVSTAEGTVYAIVDAQGTSLLTNADIAVGTSTIDLAITTSQPCSAFIKGEAYVDDNT
jgi:hypothetical protein